MPGGAGHDDIRQRVAADQAAQLFALTPRPVIAGAVFSLLVGVVLWPSLGGPTLLAWVAARLLVSGLRVWDCRDYVAHPVPADRLPQRWRRFMLLMFLECASWSSMGLLFASVAPAQTGLVLLAGLVAVAAVSVFSLGSDFRASGTFVGVILLPNAASQLVRGTPESLVAGAGMLILMALLWVEAHGLEQRMAEMLRLRHENAAIAEQHQRALLLAEHSSRAKSRFLATVSHEMRTPLNGILGMTQLLQQASSEPAQQAQLGVVAQSARHLQSVIGDLLDLSRIESNRLVINPATVRLHNVVRDVVDLLAPVATQKGLRFEVHDAPDLPEWIEADAPRVKQVLHNLLGNAIKFTATGEVELRVERAGDELDFGVRDTGIGVPADQAERIFHAFEQVATPGSPEYRAGTGLGLTISRELARAMGGDVSCAPGPGRGALFRFTLPCRPREAPQPAVAQATTAAAREPMPRPGRILVAEDNPVNAMIARAMLERMGLDVDIADDGRSALERLQQTSYAAVLMDCQMPVLDGWQATRRWRELEAGAGGRRTPIIALTANAVVGDRERCIEAGMDDYLPKPFESSDLARLMRHHLGP
jgi:two-component system, sensor histidine kinase